MCNVGKTMVADLTIHCLLDVEIFLINTKLFLKLKLIFLKSPGHNLWSDLIKFVNQFVALLTTQFQQSCN